MSTPPPDNGVGDGWLGRDPPIIQLVIAFAGVLGVLSYPLGFVILVLQLMVEYEYAWRVASHAVSLLPASLVIASSVVPLYIGASAALGVVEPLLS